MKKKLWIHNLVEGEQEYEATITIKQWVSTDRIDLVSDSVTISDYIGTLCEKLDAIIAHLAFFQALFYNQ